MNDVKIVLYGISRVGKDTLITRLVGKMRDKLVHIKGSSTLKELSNEIFQKDFSMISSVQIHHLRTVFIERLKSFEDKNQSIIVDGHYAFPNEQGGFDIVFTDFDLQGYDVFIYFKRLPKKIISNAKTSSNHPHMKWLTNESFIAKWMDFEMNQLSDICKKNNKNFVVIDDDIETSEQFLIDLINNPQMYLPSSMAANIIKYINHKINGHKRIILVDCDKTLSIEDPTFFFSDLIGIDKMKIKNIFDGDFYTIYQFYRFHKLMNQPLYQKEAALVAQKITLNLKLIEDLRRDFSDSLIIGITTGLGFVWQCINHKNDIFDLLIGYQAIQSENSFNSLITPYIKGAIAQALSNQHIHVKAIGDSIIDLEMLLNAHEGYIIANTKKDLRLVKYFEQYSNIKIKQLTYNSEKYNMIEEVESIW